MRAYRAALAGAGVGFALGMPLFEVFLLTTLAVDGGWFNAALTTRYLSQSTNLVALLILLHVATAFVGAVVGLTINRLKGRRLRVVPGGARPRT